MSTKLQKKKTLKDIDIPQMNCGLTALSKLAQMKNVSAFTLVHLARDNGQNIHVFKVADNKDLIRVVRPAIFHQKDHFVYVGIDEPLPEGEYTGFVLGNTILGRVISLAESKFIKGGKNFFTGQNKDGEQKGSGALQFIVDAAVAIVTTIGTGGNVGAAAAATAAVNSGWGAINRAQNPDELGSPGDIGKIAGDALTGAAIGLGAGGGAAGISAGGAGQSLPTVVSNFGKGAFQSIAHPINTSLHGLDAGAAGITNLGAESIASGINPGLLSQSGGQAAGAASGGINPGLLSQSGGVVATGANPFSNISNIGNFDPSQVSFNSSFDTSGVQLPSSLQTSTTPSGGTGILDKVGNAITSNPLGSAATLAGAAGIFGSKAPDYTGASPIQNYATTSQFLGPNALTQPTNDQLSTYISTPIEDLAKTFTSNSTRVSDAINQSYDNQKQGLVHQFAQAGQNLSNSSELQDKVSQLEQKRSTDLSNAALEVQNAGVSQAIQVKQQALSQGMQAGQFNQTLAMQLAGLTGDQQNLQYAIANNDYQSFQQIMGKLLTLGIPQNVNLTKTA